MPQVAWHACWNFFRAEVGKWKKHVLGSLVDRKHRCRARLAGIQRQLCYSDSSYLRSLESRIQRELGELLL